MQERLLEGEKTRLRIVTQADVALLEDWANDPRVHSEYNFFGLRRAGAIEKSFAEDGMLGPWMGELLIVTLLDEIVGLVNYRQVNYGGNDGSKAYTIGISIIEDQRGKGHGVEAQRLLARYLFSTYPVMRVEAMTDSENVPEQRALEKAGFTREGVLRQAQWRMGAWHDMTLYSKLRGE